MKNRMVTWRPHGSSAIAKLYIWSWATTLEHRERKQGSSAIQIRYGGNGSEHPEKQGMVSVPRDPAM